MKYLQRNFLFRFYSSRTDTDQILMLGCSFSLGLAAFRIFYTGTLLFVFLVWNLFLAAIPYFISQRIQDSKGKPGIRLLFFFLLWLLFIPNSFYIITDLFHLDMNREVPLWYDLALLLSFAWSGLLFGILSVWKMEKAFENMFTKTFDLFFILPIMILNGFGIYIGRYLRFNSWDVLANPFQLIQDIVYLFIHPVRNRFDWSMIACYSLFLTILYFTMKKLSKAMT